MIQIRPHGRRVQRHTRKLLFVCSQKCATCIFSANSPLRSEARLQEHLARCDRAEAPAECHHGTQRGLHIICRGFYNRRQDAYLLFRLARAWDLLRFVDPDVTRLPTDAEVDAALAAGQPL